MGASVQASYGSMAPYLSAGFEVCQAAQTPKISARKQAASEEVEEDIVQAPPMREEETVTSLVNFRPVIGALQKGSAESITSPVDRVTSVTATATSRRTEAPAQSRGPAVASRPGTDARLPGSAAGQSRDECRTETSPIGRGPAVASPCPRGPVSLLHPLQSTCVGGTLPADRPEGVGGIPPADRPGAHPMQRSCLKAGVTATATATSRRASRPGTGAGRPGSAARESRAECRRTETSATGRGPTVASHRPRQPASLHPAPGRYRFPEASTNSKPHSESSLSQPLLDSRSQESIYGSAIP
ncbi:hypothetical protein THAOC_20880 [Thalassiosira oceanica]|uniref:Uncharacterized protein n=1 Tax=Thalassiosira oceanica TaxID=159749 RepID=K0SDC4_THAOC|nr:hypothetical protein THAOC_20880 [Thalassiosira oceanica]|eukprot:EJK58956.1 hypothetical protein THAOC_20880 [Thalassiosira oceanica]